MRATFVNQAMHVHMYMHIRQFHTMIMLYTVGLLNSGLQVDRP